MSEFRKARDFLLQHRTDYETAKAGFRWPAPGPFNWAIDWFDAELAARPDSRDRCALRIVDTSGQTESRLSFLDLSRRSNQVANHLRALGLSRGDTLLLLLGNVPALWETTLAAMKLGLVIIPATPLLTRDELADRLARGHGRAIVAEAEALARCEGIAGLETLRIVVGSGREPGWTAHDDADACSTRFVPDGETGPDDPLFLYFTSGTTALPKLVCHTHRSYPIGALSTLYWLGLMPGDVHLNVSSPGWAKHAWSSLFAPWNAGATVLVVNQPAFDPKVLLRELVRCEATTFCAPPTVWRRLIQEDLASHPVRLREICASGEPLNPEIVTRVREAWGVTIRDGYGQSETTAMVGHTPGQAVKVGAMGRPLPGYSIEILDTDGRAASEGEVCVMLGEARPAGLMLGYQTLDGTRDGTNEAAYRTGDIVSTDAGGFFTFVGRSDDVFKSSDYRISPFELESVLLEHGDVAEAAVVPMPDAIRLSVPKAYVLLLDAAQPTRETALSIFRHAHERLGPYKRIRRIAFVDELPKTISGKIRRRHLRQCEGEPLALSGHTFDETEFSELNVGRPRKSG